MEKNNSNNRVRALLKKRKQHKGWIALMLCLLLLVAVGVAGMPAQEFVGETGNVTVSVRAPRGAFPEETTMTVTSVAQEGVMDALNEAARGAMVRNVQALDISFRDRDGNEIEPSLPISVKISRNGAAAAREQTTAAIPGENPESVILHMDIDGAARIVENASVANNTAEFESDSFSTYIMADFITEEFLASDGNTYHITLTYGPEAWIPEGAKLVVREILPDEGPGDTTDSEYADYLAKTEQALEKNQKVTFARFFDITIMANGEEVQPAAPVSVKIEVAEQLPEEVTAVHFAHTTETAETTEAVLLDTERTEANSRENAVSFSADGFSVFGIVGITIEKTVLASDGHNYKITVTCETDAGIPENARLEVEEILPDSDALSEYGLGYDEFVSRTEDILGLESGSTSYIRVFDIKITDADDTAVKYQPAGGNNVEVKIELADATDSVLRVVHFSDENNEAEIVESATEQAELGQIVQFSAEGFSVYTISTDFTTPVYETPVTEIQENVGYYLSNQQRYISNSAYTSEDPHGLGKTQIRSGASLFFFEKADMENNDYYIYTYTGENNTKQYIYYEYLNNDVCHVKLSNTRPSAPLTVSPYNSTGTYLIAGDVSDIDGNIKTMYMNQHSGTSGKRFAGYKAGNSDVGSRIVLTQPTQLPYDALALDGQSFALINFKSDISGYAMMADKFNNSRLQRKWMLIREDPLEHSGRMFIAENADAPMWTFHAVEGDVYYLTTEIDGVTQFLTVQAGGLTLTDEYDASTCNVHLTPGTGSYTGKIKIVGMDGAVVRMHENAANNGFGTTTNADNANDWMNLAVKSSLTDDDFVSYSAHKVSVSDTENVPDGQQIIVYTRTWNDTKKEYEFYAINHDGTLVRVYENGTELNWVGTQANTLLWDFTEYHNSDGTPNYYYELQNDYSGKYLAPQIRDSQVLSDTTVGLNLNGRRYEEYATTILAWDDPDYQYSGFRVENGRLVPCPLNEAEDFYFAVMEPVEGEQVQLTTVSTIDNAVHGITMKMIDYNGEKTNNGSFDKTQTDVMGSTGNDKGLVMPYLGENGYPTAVKTGKSLSELYEDAYDVNHLFLENIYNESGYFEYNSTENFAHLVLEEDDRWTQEGYAVGDFVVYDQVGTIETSNNSLKHGQFMPYNDLDGTQSSRWTNQTDETDAVLPYNDPRKDKPLYTIPYSTNKPEGKDNNANYHFGMEMTASFTQTADGLDAWGHDIIFEFAGDDDMFLFVDDVLILDLGGIHAAQTGKVNFRTGQMTSSKGNKDLLTLFTESYKAQHSDWTQQTLDEWLSGIFKRGSNGKLTSVFQDYSTHTMRMIYMERGAGASNLHMRFNLAAVKPGTVQLSKRLSGVDEGDAINEEYPYQIWYSTRPITGDTDEWHLLGANPGETDLVKYIDSSRTVKYAQSFSISGVEEPYSHVFFLKPGETAEITIPEGAVDYKIVECGINPQIYDHVMVNNAEVAGTPIENSTKQDYWTTPAKAEDRNTVTYDNHVNRDALRTLTLTKELFDVEGNRIFNSNSSAVFDFRLYLGGENDTEPVPANMQPYHVKDQQGNYCRWNSSTGTFESLGYDNFADMPDLMKELATFHASPNGAISKIPVDYTVEIRQILAGSSYRVVERENEIPEGYSWKGYTLTADGQTTTIMDKSGQMEGARGIIRETDPAIVVMNYKGWGISANKIWSDADFMQSHGTIYFAVFTDDRNGNLTLVEGTVQPMPSDTTSLYWYFDKLYNGAAFENHVIREVTISVDTPVLDEDGFVTDPGTVTPINEGGTLVIQATPIGSETSYEFGYTADYEQGTVNPDENNVRTDTVTNSRPGIRIEKTDWGGTPLPGAVFTLKDDEGGDVGQATYTSDQTGLVTIAYLPVGTFTLTEIVSPKGYRGLVASVTIVKYADGHITVSGAEDDPPAWTYSEATDESDGVIKIKNKPFTLKAVKVDASNNDQPLSDVHFALFRQIKATNGNLIRDYYPISGYEDLVSGEDGVIPRITQELPAGTYYLHETQTLPAYSPIETDVCFTITDMGDVVLHNEQQLPDRNCAAEVTESIVNYTLTVKNAESWQKVRIVKVDIGNPSRTLSEAVFDLYKVVDGVREETALYTGMTSGDDGILKYRKDETEYELLDLPVGVYHLIERAAPAGYNIKTAPVVITVTSTKVTYDEGTTLSQSGSGITWDSASKVYTIKVSNSAGVELPQTGGQGTNLFHLLGILLTGFAGTGFILLNRKKRAGGSTAVSLRHW